MTPGTREYMSAGLLARDPAKARSARPDLRAL
jgi:hypothetical protein